VGEKPFDLTAVVGEYETRLLRYVAHTIGSTYDEAQDVVQDAFLRLHRQVTTRGEDSVDNMRCWLFRVAHNLAMDYGRRRGRAKKLQEQVMSDPVLNPVSQANTGGGPTASIARRESCDLAMHELQELPEEQKHVVLLKIIHGMTLQEVSDITGLKIGTVNYRLTQGLRTLSQRLKALEAI